MKPAYLEILRQARELEKLPPAGVLRMALAELDTATRLFTEAYCEANRALTNLHRMRDQIERTLRRQAPSEKKSNFVLRDTKGRIVARAHVPKKSMGRSK